MVKDKGFYSLYPSPNDLLAPVDTCVRDYPYDYDVFANFHFTMHGMSVCIRNPITDHRYSVAVRGFVPIGCEHLRLRFDNSWTTINKFERLSDAIDLFRSIVKEVLDMPLNIRRGFQSDVVASYIEVN